MTRFLVEHGRLQGILKITPPLFHDDRGFFAERFKESEFAALDLGVTFKQDNHSHSKRGVLRGLHYQCAPHEQAKLVWVAAGRIFDVCVDVRASSPSFGQWEGFELNSSTGTMLFVPAGFAHGFLTLSETADVVYRCSNEYEPSAEAGLKYDDATVAIEWPAPPALISDKDAALPPLEAIVSPSGRDP